jgi:hypothetical protein
MKNNNIFIAILCIGSFLTISPAYAGMPSFSLTDIASFRLSTISFFLMIYLLVSWSIFKLWNFLGNDFPQLPKLPFSKALALVFLWGLAFHLMLVMIAGTRELMTPAAWEKAGITYKITPESRKQFLDARRHKIALLKQSLWQFAKDHKGKFPSEPPADSVAEEVWRVPTGDFMYRYVNGLTTDSPVQPLAYEPDSYGVERLVLFTNGQIELLSINTLQSLIAEKK